MKATHKKTKQLVGYKKVELEPGQFIFGRKKAAIETGMSEQNIRTCLDSLKTMENLTIKSTNKYSIISIVNWESYQQDHIASNQQRHHQVTSNQPSTNHKQEVKEHKKKEKHIELVFLSKDEFKKLTQDYGPEAVNSKIEDLNNYIASTGKKYKSHYHTIRNWMKRDGVQVRTQGVQRRVCPKCGKESDSDWIAKHDGHCPECGTILQGEAGSQD